jgi:Trypsin-co-occurring domain 1
MSPLVEFPLAAGGGVLVEVTSPSPAGQSAWDDDDAPVTRGRLRDRADAMTERAGETFDAAIGAIQPAAELLLSMLTDLSRVPDEIAVEFAVELSAEAGAFIATLSSAAHFKIALTWRRPDVDQSQAGPSESMTPTGARSDQAVPGST